MSDILWSAHIDDALYELVWEHQSGVADQWSVLFRLLAALDEQARVLGSVTGTVRVGHGPSGDQAFEEWPVDTKATALRARIESVDVIPALIDLHLGCEPLLWLADDRLKVLDYDDVISDGSDLWSPGSATITEVTDGAAGAQGLRLWRLHHSPVLLLSLRGSFGETSMGLEVSSKCDLWRSMRLDGDPNSPHGEANAGLLARTVAEIAVATGARLQQ